MELLRTIATAGEDSPGPRADPCIMVIFGAGGDLTKRLLMPALYNLLCDDLLPAKFAIVGLAREPWTTADFRERMARDLRTFSTRKEFDAKTANSLCERLHYLSGEFGDDAAFARLHVLVKRLDAELGTGGNILFYLATPPSVFGLISSHLDKAGFKENAGWKRIIVEKPFGTDLASARELNRTILSFWDEGQIYRVDHYLGKETVQNILAFRFANQMFEPLWSKQHIDHIQFNVAEAVSVEGRGKYYDGSGVLRDMVQNHMLQMLAYLCMEPPVSFAADDIRDEKAKVLKSVRIYNGQEVLANSVRGQYGPGKKIDGTPSPGYRAERDVNPQSNTETFAALRLFIDNWRWDGVPIYLRSGKALWKRGTEIIVQFKKAPAVLFKGTAAANLSSNRLIFHIQPDEAIESLFQAKTPGPTMRLQPVNMRFSYGDAFRASRGTGYEVMIYSCMCGDPTLFSRTDLVETAWRIAQPFLDTWVTVPADFPNYSAGTWGPRSANDLIEQDGRRWFEVINRETLERVPLFKGGDPVFLNQICMALQPRAAKPGETIIRKGEPGLEMYMISRGECEVLDSSGEAKIVMREGDAFGEIALLLAEPRTATVRAKTMCDLFVLDKADFNRILHEQPKFAQAIKEIALERYQREI
jgi:glucose-6-phosphate 1-dehydrogenase